MAETEFSIELLRNGDRAEFARVVDAYYQPLYRLALRMTGTEQDAEDVLQNTFLKALQHLPNFEARSSLSTWLYRIAANESLMMLRRQRRTTPIEDSDTASPEEEGEVAPVQITDWCCLPEDEFLTSESKKELEAAIQRLPDSLKIVFLLRDIQGLSIKETSEALNLSETNVKTRLLRARLHLREQLSSYFGEKMAVEKKQ